MLQNFLQWYLNRGFKKFLTIWKQWRVFVWWHFSILLFLHTLFSPWHRNVAFKDWRGFRPLRFLENVIWNGFSRIVGAIVRIMVMISGLSVWFLLFLGGLLFVLTYFTLPLIFIASIISSLFFSVFYGAFFLLLILVTVSMISLLYIDDENQHDYHTMSLLELSKQSWFDRVYRRFNIDKNLVTETIFQDDEKLQLFLKKYNISVEEFKNIVNWEIEQQNKIEEKKRIFSKEHLLRQRPIGLYWHFGYTVFLDHYTEDLGKHLSRYYSAKNYFGLEKELHNLETVLVRPNENCAIIVGEPGVGRHTIVSELINRIRNGGYLGMPLQYMRVLKLDLKAVIVRIQDEGGNSESVVRRLFTEAGYAGNIILVIDNIDQYLDFRYTQNFSFPALIDEFASLESFRMIGITSKERFYGDMNRDTVLMKHFNIISVEEMSEGNVLNVLLQRFSQDDKIFFTYQALRQVIVNANRYMNNGPLPARAVNLAMKLKTHWRKMSKTGIVSEEDVNEFVSLETGIPLGKIDKTESSKLLSLEKLLHQRIIGQDYAVKVVSSAVRRMRSGMARANKPAGSFLFLGPTGVGKTEMAKVLAEQYFGSEDKLIRLDMSEFQGESALGRLIGSRELKQEGVLTTAAQNHPYSLLLLDEIEKANPRALDIFLQILDEGFVHDGYNHKINFTSMIIIATSNAASSKIKEMVEKGINDEEIKKSVIDTIIAQGIFRPEFLNRFDDVVVFHSLRGEEIPLIVQLALNKFSQRIKKEQHIDIVFDKGVVEQIIREGFDPVFGARSLLRYINDVIADALARKIIADNIHRGEIVKFGVDDLNT